MKPSLSDLRQMLEPIILRARAARLECDGYAKVFHTVLTDWGMPHSLYVGEIRAGHRVFKPHLWIELPLSDVLLARLDCAARLWLADSPDIPDGLVDPTLFPHVVYSGQSVFLETLPPWLFDFLLTPWIEAAGGKG